MQEGEKSNGMKGMSVEEISLGVREFYQETQLRAQEENGAFARTEFFRMDKFETYRLRILSIAPSPDDSPIRPGYEYPVYQLLLELERPTIGNKPQRVYVAAARATDAEYSVGPIETYRRMAVEAAKEDGDDKLVEKIAGGSFGGGLKCSYGHYLYIFDPGERVKGVRMMTLSHTQFKDLDEREFKLWNKKLARNPSYPCSISSVYDAYPVEIEKRKNGAKAEYIISIDNESEPVPLAKEELIALVDAPRIPEVIYRYTRYHLGATVEFLKRCDSIYGISLMETDEMKTVIDALDGELPREDISALSFDHRTKDNREDGHEGGGISLDDLFECYDELQQQELGEKTEEGRELRAMIRGYIEQEELSVRVTRSTSNRELFDLIENEMGGPKPNDEPEDVPGEEEEQPGETREHTEHPRHRK